MKDYYKILQVNKTASLEIIGKVYKILAKKYHPDANPNNKEEAEANFKEISEAYETLSNEEKRKQYDIELNEFEQQSQVQSNVVPLQDFINLKNYCEQLENEINTYHYSQSNSNPQINTKVQSQAYEDAINEAYQNAYVNELKNMGYKIKYKKTFKEIIKSYLTLFITAIIIFIIFKIIWMIPPLKNAFLSLFKI